MTLWKTSITSKLLEIGNSFFHTRRARLRGVFSSNKTIRSHLTVMTLWFWQVELLCHSLQTLNKVCQKSAMMDDQNVDLPLAGGGGGGVVRRRWLVTD